MASKGMSLESGHYNLSPNLFRLAAEDYFQCYLDFQKPTDRPSAVPYFLCCLVMELSMKAVHLEKSRREEVKKLLLHDLVKSYQRLPHEQQTLSKDECRLLNATNKIYMPPIKGFEYISLSTVARGYTDFPDLDALERVTRKIMALSEHLSVIKG